MDNDQTLYELTITTSDPTTAEKIQTAVRAIAPLSAGTTLASTVKRTPEVWRYPA